MRKKWSKTLIYLICIIISLVLLFINEHYVKADAVLYNLLLTLAVTLLTTGIMSMLSNKFLDNSIDEAAATNFLVLKHCQDYGLIGIYDEFPLNDDKIRDDFLGFRQLTNDFPVPRAFRYFSGHDTRE